MLPLPELVDRLKAVPHRELRSVEKATGVPYRTIRNIRHGWTRNPRVNTAAALSDWLEQQPDRANT